MEDVLWPMVGLDQSKIKEIDLTHLETHTIDSGIYWNKELFVEETPPKRKLLF